MHCTCPWQEPETNGKKGRENREEAGFWVWGVGFRTVAQQTAHLSQGTGEMVAFQMSFKIMVLLGVP